MAVSYKATGSWQRVTKGHPCPICGKPDYCEISQDGRTVHCMRVENEHPIAWRQGGWLHRLDSQSRPKTQVKGTRPRNHSFSFDYRQRKWLSKEQRQPQPQPHQQEPGRTFTTVPGYDNSTLPASPATSETSTHPDKAELAKPEQRAAAINWLLARLNISLPHQAYLFEKEGFELERAYHLGYRTFPASHQHRKALLKELEAEFGRALCRGLGFVYERTARGGSSYLEFAAIPKETEALLFPVRNAQGLIVALKARWEATDPETGKLKRYYRAMSAGNTELGAKVGTPLHVARPEGGISPELEGVVFVTEGEKKADYAADALGTVVVGVQGTGSWRAGRLLPLLLSLKAHTIVEAFDADKVLNPTTLRQARELSEQCAAAGYKVYSAEWDLTLDGKGLDDFCRSRPGDMPILRRFGPLQNNSNLEEEEVDAGLDREFKRRYGFSRRRAERIAREYVLVEQDTMNHRLGLREKQRQSWDTLTLEQAREQIQQLIGEWFQNHLEEGEPRLIALKATTGTGKSASATRAIEEHLRWQRPGRIIYITDTKQAYASLIAPGGLLYPYTLSEGEDEKGEPLSPRLAIREGRSPDDKSPYLCKLYADCQLLGQHRQPAAIDACAKCPFGSLNNHKTYLKQNGLDPETPMTWNCQKQGYFKTVNSSKEARVVIAPSAAILNASWELREFDFILIDEDCLDYLLEKQSLSAAQLGEWEENRRRIEADVMAGVPIAEDSEELKEGGYRLKDQEGQGDGNPSLDEVMAKHAPFDRLGELLKTALYTFDQGSTGLDRARLLPLLQEVAEARRIDLVRLVEKCEQIRPGRLLGRYHWEKPFHRGSMLIAPLRLAYDFVQTLHKELCLDNFCQHQQEQKQKQQQEGDTQLWIERRASAGNGNSNENGEKGWETAILLYLPRSNILQIMQGSLPHNKYKNDLEKPPSVLFLDATCGPVFKLALPKVEEIQLAVEQPLYVIQVRNSLFTPATLRHAPSLKGIGRAIGELAHRFEAERPVVFSRKEFNPDYAPPDAPARQVEEGLALAAGGIRYGHYERHNKGLNDFTDTDLLAIIGPCSDPLDEIEARVMAFRQRQGGLTASERRGRYQLKCYQWRDAEGQGLARWCKSHSDPDIQAAIEHSFQANVWQTIGRGRAALRPEDKPLVVALFSAMPVEGLPVKELTTVKDLLGEERISYAQRQALDEGRQTNNQEKQEETLCKIEEAKAGLAAEGKQWVALGTFARQAGVSRKTLWKLGYRHFVRVRDIREVLPLDIMIIIKLRPVVTRLETSPALTSVHHASGAANGENGGASPPAGEELASAVVSSG